MLTPVISGFLTTPNGRSLRSGPEPLISGVLLRASLQLLKAGIRWAIGVGVDLAREFTGASGNHKEKGVYEFYHSYYVLLFKELFTISLVLSSISMVIMRMF